MQQFFERRRVVEAQIVDIDHSLELLSQFRVVSDVVEIQTGIHKVSLTFTFAGVQAGEQRSAALEARQRIARTEALAHPIAELSAREIGIVKDRIEAAGLVIECVVIAGRIEVRVAEAHPVQIIRCFRSVHICIDGQALAGKIIVRVCAHGVIELVGDVPAADVTVAARADIVYFVRVRLQIADRRRT